MLTFNTKPVPHFEARKILEGKPVVTRDVYDKLPDEIQADAFTITGVEDFDILQGIRDRITDLPAGTNWDDVKKDIAKDLSPWFSQKGAEARAQILLHHHGFSAYAKAQARVMDELEDVFPYRQYISTEDSKVRRSHAALNGIILESDHVFWEKHTPPWEWNCRCDVVELTGEDMEEERGKDADRPLHLQRVLEGPALKQLGEGQINRGPSTNIDIRTPKERGGTYENNVRRHGLDYSQIRQRWSKDTRTDFETWAKDQEAAGGTLYSVLTGTTPLDTPRRPSSTTAPPIPQPKPPGIKPVSAALKNNYKTRAHKKPISDAIDAIDSVHDDGTLPDLPMEGSAGKALGAYKFFDNGKAHAISIKSTGSWPALTTVHEIGHFLDHQAIDARGSFSSTGNGTLAKVITSIRESKAYTALSQNKRVNLNYYLQPEELWARAYAQYIATRSAKPVLIKGIAAIRTSGLPDRQWSDDDFKPIAKEIDDAFTKLGWNPQKLK